MSVVLPAPFGPRNPNAHPRGTCRSMDWSAARSPKRLPRPWVSIANSVMGRSCAVPAAPASARGTVRAGRLIRSDERDLPDAW